MPVQNCKLTLEDGGSWVHEQKLWKQASQASLNFFRKYVPNCNHHLSLKRQKRARPNLADNVNTGKNVWHKRSHGKRPKTPPSSKVLRNRGGACAASGPLLHSSHTSPYRHNMLKCACDAYGTLTRKHYMSEAVARMIF